MTQAGSLHGAFLAAAERYPDNLALSLDPEGLTYADLAARIGNLAASLQRDGLEPGDRAVVALPNGAEFVLAHFAVLAAGGISTPCDPMMPPDRLAQVVEVSDARFVLTTSDVAAALSTQTPVPHVLTAEELKHRSEDGRAVGFSPSPRAGADTAVLLFTTGSTGRPKGVVLSHEATLWTINNLRSVLGYRPEDRELICLPLTHSFGLGHLYCNLFSGGAVRLERGLLSLKRVLAGLRDLPATGFPTTPTGVAMLLDRAAEPFAAAAQTLRFMVVNSAPLPPDRTSQLQSLLPHVEIVVYYGLTEASRSTLLSLTKAGPALFRSVGKPMPGVEIKLDPETSEVAIRGPHMCKQYWKDPDLTRNTFVDGWMKTGDVGRFDEEGRLFLIARLKDQINVGGNKVEPGEVEAVVLASGLVEDAGVCGLPASASAGGEEVACAVVAAGEEVELGQLAQFCGARLEAYKVPTRWIPLTGIPRAQTGKILRAELAAAMKAELANLEQGRSS